MPTGRVSMLCRRAYFPSSVRLDLGFFLNKVRYRLTAPPALVILNIRGLGGVPEQSRIIQPVPWGSCLGASAS